MIACTSAMINTSTYTKITVAIGAKKYIKSISNWQKTNKKKNS